ncbi:MAG: beta-ketoacyl synthase N-terminal-like domain-containing protein, partial [Acidobacteriota bacterium]
MGQDAAFAAPLTRRFRTVAGILQGLQDSLRTHVQAARTHCPLDRQAPLARSHGTEYPIVQGPMTRVSDVPEFVVSVSEAGGLPFLALALFRAPQVRKLLEETQSRLGNRPWGVGILGFVPPDLRQEQLEVIQEFRPPYALIAGGRPDQAEKLENDGIATYLHVPSPSLLRSFLKKRSRRFVFEGRECGGHVGPRSSFVLWEGMIQILLDAVDEDVQPEDLHILFAAGIHDARSAAMVAAMAGPLAERGVRVGVLMGTAYLFTAEAVSSTAIVEGFQKVAVECSRTVLLEVAPGHSIRCAETPFFKTFQGVKRKLSEEKKSQEEIQQNLEHMNLGRLRIASKGISRQSEVERNSKQVEYVKVSEDQQRADGMYMIGQLATMRKDTCQIADLHRDVSLGSSALLQRLPVLPEKKEKAGAGAGEPCEVAIIGMGCLLPKAPDVQTFWSNVLNKVDAITEIPKSRFNPDLYFDKERKSRDRIYSKWGGFLEDVVFDPMRYGIPPNSLSSIDPFQLLTLEVVHQALGDAGYLEREFPRERTGVILGTSGGLGDLGMQYGVRSSLPMFLGNVPSDVLERLPEWTEDSFAGILLNVAAGRVSNRFDLGGINFTVDAACASSLAAVYLATRELVIGTSDMVLAGGLDTVQSPFGFLCFSSTQALSPEGRCKTFDESADGIAISEGLAVLVLKRRTDAERDGDRIYATIQSVASSSDGRGKSLTAPRLEGQVQALKRAYSQAGISPATVDLIEAHGTGTVAGDSTEVDALNQVFGAAGAKPKSCALGSVKSMIGHTKGAAGVTGVMKIALALYHKLLPPTLHVQRPNPELRKESSPFFVNTEALPWISRNSSVPRRAGISSFGFGGTNFHAVLEEYEGDFTDPARRPPTPEWPSEMFFWSSSSADELRNSLESLETWLAREGQPVVRDLASTICGLGSPVY